jgi:hypothetical protein
LVRGADQDYGLPHSGYDHELSSGSLRSLVGLNADAIESPDDKDLHFDKLSEPMEIPALCFPEHIFSFFCMDLNRNPISESEPDSVVKAFAKRAIAAVTKAKKLVMQDEVDHPESFGDFGSDSDDEIPEEIQISELDNIADEMEILDSDESHIFPLSDDAPINVVRFDHQSGDRECATSYQEMSMVVDLESDLDIEFPSSPKCLPQCNLNVIPSQVNLRQHPLLIFQMTWWISSVQTSYVVCDII